jgi:hypothetical protein
MPVLTILVFATPAFPITHEFFTTNSGQPRLNVDYNEVQTLVDPNSGVSQYGVNVEQALTRGFWVSFWSGSYIHCDPEDLSLPTYYPDKPTAFASIPWTIPKEDLLTYEERRAGIKPKGAYSLDDVAKSIGVALHESGYSNFYSYWLARGHGPGFVLICPVEQIRADGTPVSKNRWSFDVPAYEFSIKTLLSAMFKALPGYYRMILFVVSEKDIVPKDVELTAKALKEASPGFLEEPPKEKASKIPVTPGFHCGAYVYEFERPTRNDDPVFKDHSDLSARTHLASTGLWDHLVNELK